jgi:hypothetical protein
VFRLRPHAPVEKPSSAGAGTAEGDRWFEGPGHGPPSHLGSDSFSSLRPPRRRPPCSTHIGDVRRTAEVARFAVDNLLILRDRKALAEGVQRF